jgi:hypothetical protein
MARWEPPLLRSLHRSLRFRRFAAKYFVQMEVEYESICSPEYQAQTSAEVQALRVAANRRPSWHLNHRLEYLLWLGLPPAILRQRTFVHRARLMALIGPEGASTFAEAFPPPDDHLDQVEQLRAEGLGVLLEIQRLRHVQSEFAKLRNRLLVSSLFPGAAFVAIALWHAQWFEGMTLAEVAAFMGMMGGYLSVLLRAGALRWSPKYAANYQQVDRVFWNVLCNFCLSVLEGSLGAVVLYLAFSSGILKGSIFPTIPTLPPMALLSTPRLILKATDLTHETLTQLMLWSVAAGFSERAAPDFLSSLSKELAPAKPSEEAPRKGA